MTTLAQLLHIVMINPLTITNPPQMDVVLANGTQVVANATSHPDLYWALRGGSSGSFGIVTRFTVNVFPLPENTVFKMNFNHDAAIIDHWQRNYISSAPIELTTQLTVFRSTIEIIGHYQGPEVYL